MDETEWRALRPGAQVAAAFHEAGDIVAREQRENVLPQLVIRDGIVQHQRAHPLQHFDSTAPGFFGRSQYIVIAFARFVVDRGDELVLHLDDAVGALRTRRVQKTEHDGTSLGRWKATEMPDVVAITPASQKPPRGGMH